jgi:hypothetical protein
VYRANDAAEEYSQITVAPVADTCFTDSVTLKTLTTSVFYMVMAIDMRQNHSRFSQPLQLKRPIRVAPVSPVFRKAESSPDGVYLEWLNSSNDDVKTCFLYRSIPNSKEWKLIAFFNAADSVTHYMDSDADSTDYCFYTLIAKNESNVESSPSNPVKGKKIDTGVRPGIDKIFTVADKIKEQITLGWKQPLGNVHRCQIYRAKGDGELSLYSSVEGNANTFIDKNIQPNSIYQYSIRIMYEDGGMSPFSSKTMVKY